jgi:hypothetical protein
MTWPFATLDRTAVVVGGSASLIDELVSQPLMRAFQVVMSREFFHRSTEMALAKWDHLVQALGLDR